MWLKRWLSNDEIGEFDAELILDSKFSTVFAVGDVHGCADLAKKLERQILATTNNADLPVAVVYLGDVIDRGPESAQFLEHFLTPLPRGYERLLIGGNHELMFRAFLDAPNLSSRWIAYGGRETLQSYGILVDEMQKESIEYVLETAIPKGHRELLAKVRPYLVWRDYVLVHSGLDIDKSANLQVVEKTSVAPANYPEQFAKFGKTVVHGHRVVEHPILDDHQIALDTGAFATGRLSFAKLALDQAVEIGSITR
jgi:serine/threonine protein phosphatase 1